MSFYIYFELLELLMTIVLGAKGARIRGLAYEARFYIR